VEKSVRAADVDGAVRADVGAQVTLEAATPCQIESLSVRTNRPFTGGTPERALPSTWIWYVVPAVALTVTSALVADDVPPFSSSASSLDPISVRALSAVPV
jgi:hypothetical protein